MIPSVNDGLKQDFEIEKQPTRTYKMNLVDMKITGFVDGPAAMKQAIYKILNTERYNCLIYSWNYGAELADLFGEPLPFVYPEIKRRVTEALIQDERITSVDGFTFTSKKGEVFVQFTVYTTEGDIEIEKVVKV